MVIIHDDWRYPVEIAPAPHIWRNEWFGLGASMFPVVVALTGIPACFLLASPHGYRAVAVMILIIPSLTSLDSLS